MRKGRFALLKILIIFIIAGIFWMPVSVFADAETAAAETEGAAPGFREQAMALKRQREKHASRRGASGQPECRRTHKGRGCGIHDPLCFQMR